MYYAMQMWLTAVKKGMFQWTNLIYMEERHDER